MTPGETLALVELADTLGVQLNPAESDEQGIRACTTRAKQFVDALAESTRILAMLAESAGASHGSERTAEVLADMAAAGPGGVVP